MCIDCLTMESHLLCELNITEEVGKRVRTRLISWWKWLPLELVFLSLVSSLSQFPYTGDTKSKELINYSKSLFMIQNKLLISKLTKRRMLGKLALTFSHQDLSSNSP